MSHRATVQMMSRDQVTPWQEHRQGTILSRPRVDDFGGTVSHVVFNADVNRGNDRTNRNVGDAGPQTIMASSAVNYDRRAAWQTEVRNDVVGNEAIGWLPGPPLHVLLCSGHAKCAFDVHAGLFTAPLRWTPLGGLKQTPAWWALLTAGAS